MKNKKGFASLIGLLIAVGIILVLAFLAYKSYFNNPRGVDKETSKYLSQQGIDTTNSRSTLETTKKQIADAEKLMLDRQKQWSE